MDSGLGLGSDAGDLMERIQAQVHAQISEQFREQVRRCCVIPCSVLVFKGVVFILFFLFSFETGMSRLSYGISAC
jgi:hypothetical protein